VTIVEHIIVHHYKLTLLAPGGWIPRHSRFFENSSKTTNAMMLKFFDN